MGDELSNCGKELSPKRYVCSVKRYSEKGKGKKIISMCLLLWAALAGNQILNGHHESLAILTDGEEPSSATRMIEVTLLCPVRGAKGLARQFISNYPVKKHL